VRILILGGDGMLGHQLLKSWQDTHDVRVTLRQNQSHYAKYNLFHTGNSFYNIDVRGFDDVIKVAETFKPDAVVNAVGIIKQRTEAQDAIMSLEINSLLPHRLSSLCEQLGSRLIHISTDCVFSGSKGNYLEDDLEDASDLYGRSKLLGEVTDSSAVTLRTSIIGLELARKKSLVEWFLNQRGAIRGFIKTIYSGFTTQELARIIEFILLKHSSLSGLWHVASAPINKYDLLKKLGDYLNKDNIKIEPSDELVCDRSLNASRFNETIGYQPPSWDEMLKELAQQIRERNHFTG
jgi:dTDP-4-dehydrorhamnose reductase